MVSKTSMLPLVRAFDWKAVDTGLREKRHLVKHRDERGRDTEEDAFKKRSWRTGFLKKRPSVALVDPLEGLQAQVGARSRHR
jgi:hypothetical protein